MSEIKVVIKWTRLKKWGDVFDLDDEDEKIYHGNRWHAVVKNSEAMMIYFHSPPYNSKNISNPPKFRKKLRIINIGDCGDLYPEISHEALQLEKLSPRPSDV